MSSRPPVALIGAGLLFWGWQTGFFLPAALMAVILESATWVRPRWELKEEDFNRIWTFCTLLLLAALVFSFTNNQGPSEFRTLLENPNLRNQRSAGVSTGRTAAAVLRWLPMLFFLFYGAQRYSTRQGVPLTTLSLILGRRWKRAKNQGLPVGPSPNVDVSYGYFGLCLLAASVHEPSGLSYFWGVSALMAFALVIHRSRRTSILVWAAALVVAAGLGFLGQRGVTGLQGYLENLNPQWLSRFQRGRFDAREARTAIGRIGRVQASGAIVLRLQTTNNESPPELLREASYGSYRNEAWYGDLAISSFGYVQETNDVWLLLPEKTNVAQVTIACYLPDGKGLLPLPSGAGRLENLPAYLLQKNNYGTVLAQGPGLVSYDAHYGPGASIDAVPGPDDLKVPPRETNGLARIVGDLKLSGKPREQVLLEVSRFFARHFNYSTWQPETPVSQASPLTRFLFETRSGHCEYFATATTLLLRQAGLQARYAVGYYVHESPSADKWVVRQRDAHAWCLVWDEEREVWENFDTTPATWLQQEARRASHWQWLSDAWSRIRFEIAKVRWGQTSIRSYLLWGLIPVLFLLLYQILKRAKRERQRRAAAAEKASQWPGLDSDFYQLELLLKQRGIFRGAAEPLTQWLGRATKDPALAGIRHPLEAVLRLHYRYRFDPEGLNSTDREELRRQTRNCLELARNAGPAAP